MGLGDRDLEVLGDLEVACRLSAMKDGWVRPLDCGGRNGSDHSYRLTKLAKLGLAEEAPRGGYSRGSKKYRITDAGRTVLSERSER